jgi:hypothetical protein
MVDFVFVGSSQVGNQASVMASDYNSASTGRLDIIHMVFCMKPFLLTGLLENIGILIAANAADIKNRVGRKHILSPTGGILCSSSWNQFGVVVLDEVFIETHVLLFSKDRIVVLNTILL